MTGNRDTLIAEQAYYLWESEGRPADKALDHWLRAEAGLVGKPARKASASAARPSKPRQARRKTK